jgi:FAD:protein FMN transferase
MMKEIDSHIRLIVFISFAFLASCGQKETAIKSFQGYAQGTTYSMVYADNIGIDPGKLKNQVEDILFDFDMSLSLYRDSSVLSRINRNEDVIPDEYFTEAFTKSVEISRMTDGAFDITIGPLAGSWGFGPDEKPDFAWKNSTAFLILSEWTRYGSKMGASLRLTRQSGSISMQLHKATQLM